MPRTARLDIPDLLQHVIVRGVNRCDIFLDDQDRRRFVDRFSTLLVETGTECYAWALMSNHFHLLLRPRLVGLAPLMRRLLTGHAIYFNRRHNRSGHLFQNRYKSIVCDENAYLLELVRYIHLNPLRACVIHELDELGNYLWSGHRGLMGHSMLPGQAVDEVLRLFSEGKTKARQLYAQFLADGIDMGFRSDLVGACGKREWQEEVNGSLKVPDSRILGGDEFFQGLLRQKCLAPRLIAGLDLAKIVQAVCGHYGVLPENLRKKIRPAGVAEVRSLICYLGVEAGHSGAKIGEYVGLGRSGVSQAFRRGAQLVGRNPELIELVNK